MKHLLLASLMIFALGCKKSTTTPAYRPSSPTSPTNTLNAFEQVYLGNWIMDKKEGWGNGVIINTEITTDSLTCHINFKATDNAGWKECIMGQYCQNVQGIWKADDAVYINFANIYYLVEVKTATTMILTYGAISSSVGYKFYFHKGI